MNRFTRATTQAVCAPRSIRGAAAALALMFAASVPAAAQQQQPDLSKEVATVKRMMATPQLQSALKFVESQIANPKDVIQDWLGVCNAPGPSRDEVYRARHIYKMFRIYGLEQVYIDDYKNVTAIRPGAGTGAKTVLTAHHDNVPIWPKEQPVNAFERDGRVYCPAAGDDIPGVVQLFTVLRAMQEAKIQTQGDVWFVTFSGEETESFGALNFAKAHYLNDLDWKNGDALVQLHGGAGDGVTTGSVPITNRATLRFFTPFERSIEGQAGADRRWRPHAVDVLSRALVRIRTEVTDERPDCLRCTGANANAGRADRYLNISMVAGSPVVNRPTSEASVRIDMRADSWADVRSMQAQIKKIAAESCNELQTKGFPPHNNKERCGFMFDINGISGRDRAIDPMPGWDPLNNPMAKMVAAASNVLYGTKSLIDGARGCGDCINLYQGGLPGMSFRGGVTDYGNGRFELERRTETEERPRQGGHDITESMSTPPLWAGIKHALVFAVSYAGVQGVPRN